MAQREYRVDMEEALRRAQLKLDEALFKRGINAGPDDPPFDDKRRDTLTSIAIGYLELVKIMQAERDWEDRKIKEIKGDS